MTNYVAFIYSNRTRYATQAHENEREEPEEMKGTSGITGHKFQQEEIKEDLEDSF